MNEPTDGWSEWAKYVLEMLKHNNVDHRDMKDDLSIIKQEIAVLKVKSGAWGAVAGFLAALIPIVLALALKLL